MGYSCFFGPVLALAVLLGTRPTVSGHGRLLHPPSRSSMWRLGFKTPRNYNDHELFCGGFSRQQSNGMRCGVCGDPYDSPAPRPNEMGGKYYTGIISDKYRSGEVRTVTVELTANHRGFFEFRLCPVNGNASMESDECMTQHPIEVVGEGRRENESPYKYFVDRPNRGEFDIKLRFPEKMTCPHCVFQWTYTAGNNWGPCSNGTYKVGCGPQETFRGCADITIEPETGESSPEPVPVPAPPAIPPTIVRPNRPFRPHYQSPPDRRPQRIPSPHRPVARPTYRPLYTPPTTSWDHWNSGNAWPNTVNPGYPHSRPSTTTWFYHQWPATPSTTFRPNRFHEHEDWPSTPDLKTSPRPSLWTHNWSTDTPYYHYPSRRPAVYPFGSNERPYQATQTPFRRHATSPRPRFTPPSPRLPEQEEWPSTPDLKTSPRPFPKRRPPHRKWNPEMDDFPNEVPDKPTYDEKPTERPLYERPVQHPHNNDKPQLSPDVETVQSPSHNVHRPVASPPQWEQPSAPPSHWNKATTTRPPRRPTPTLPPVVDVDVVQNEVFQPPVVTERPPAPKIPGQLQCRGAGAFGGTPGMDQWCSTNCNHLPPYCPSSHCKCD